MRNRWFHIVSALLVISVLLAGCSQAERNARSADFARRILDCIYAGSLSPVDRSVHHYYRLQTPDWLTAAMGASLRDKYGSVKDLKLVSVRTANLGNRIAVWTVSTERHGFQMRLAFDRTGKVIYMSFRPSSQDVWTPAVQMAHQYITTHMRKTQHSQ